MPRADQTDHQASDDAAVSRRRLLGTAAGVAAAASLGLPGVAAAGPRHGHGGHGRDLVTPAQRGLMTYTVRDAVARDPALYPTQPSGYRQVFEAAAEIGYRNIELFHFTPLPVFAQHPAAEGGAAVAPAQLREWLDAYGLRSSGNYGNINPDTIDVVLDTAEALGAPFIGSGDPTGVPGSVQKADWDAQIEAWNICAAKAAARGIRIYAHAHWLPWDFLRDTGPVDANGLYTRSSGIRCMEYWLANTDPRWVAIEVDTYWLFAAAGIYTSYTAADGSVVDSPMDPIAMVAGFGRRAAVFHAKDGVSASAAGSPGSIYPPGYVWCPFGAGDMPLADLFRAVARHRPILNVEQDNGPGTGTGTLLDPSKSLRDAALSYRGLAELGRRHR